MTALAEDPDDKYQFRLKSDSEVLNPWRTKVTTRKCPECVVNSLKSITTQTQHASWGFSTTGFSSWDEDGKLILPQGWHHKAAFKCSQGHKWEED